MDSENITDDELIRSLCQENNKRALIMIFDRHSEYLYRYSLRCIRSTNLIGRVINGKSQESVASLLLVEIFEDLWDSRATLLDKIDGIQFRLRDIDLLPIDEVRLKMPAKQRTVREYLIDAVRHIAFQIPGTIESDMRRRQ